MQRQVAWLMLSVFLVLCFGYSVLLYIWFTPVYRHLSCPDKKRKIESVSKDSRWVNVTGTLWNECRNPNEYELEFVQDLPSPVYWRRPAGGLRRVGLNQLDSTVFPARGRSTCSTEFRVEVRSEEGQKLLHAPATQLLAVISGTLEARISVLFMTLTFRESIFWICGLELRIPSREVGPIACARSPETLVIPGSGDSSGDIDNQTVATTPSAAANADVHLAPEQLRSLAQTKNAVLVTAMLGFGSAAVITLFIAVRVMPRVEVVKGESAELM